jgi:hypothetical protein
MGVVERSVSFRTIKVNFIKIKFISGCLNGADNKDCLLDKDLPCGTLLRFPQNDPNINGFMSGYYYDGSKGKHKSMMKNISFLHLTLLLFRKKKCSPAQVTFRSASHKEIHPVELLLNMLVVENLVLS